MSAASCAGSLGAPDTSPYDLARPLVDTVSVHMVSPPWAARVVSPLHDVLSAGERRAMLADNPDSYLHVTSDPLALPRPPGDVAAESVQTTESGTSLLPVRPMARWSRALRPQRLPYVVPARLTSCAGNVPFLVGAGRRTVRRLQESIRVAEERRLSAPAWWLRTTSCCGLLSFCPLNRRIGLPGASIESKVGACFRLANS